MNTRRSFLKTLAAAVIAGPVLAKAALEKREMPAWRTVFNPNWKEIDLRPKTEPKINPEWEAIAKSGKPYAELQKDGSWTVYRDWYDAKK